MADPETSNSGADAHGGHEGGSDIDLDKLAERVYRLMMQDIRLGLVRGEALPGGASARRSG